MAFDHACLTNQSFNETLDSISKVWNNIPTNIVSNRMAAVTSDGEEKFVLDLTKDNVKIRTVNMFIK